MTRCDHDLDALCRTVDAAPACYVCGLPRPRGWVAITATQEAYPVCDDETCELYVLDRVDGSLMEAREAAQ